MPPSQGPYQPPSSSSAANSATHTPTNSEIQPTPANTPDTQRPTSARPPSVPLSDNPNSVESNSAMASADEILASYHLPSPKPLWLNVSYAKHIVKGNFMTLSARPKTVESGEWIAHQVVEHWRMLITFIKLVQEREDDGSSICNHRSCPKMSAGPNHSFTWLNSRLEPVEIPAYEYLSLVQRYVGSKIDDAKIFPTDAAASPLRIRHLLPLVILPPTGTTGLASAPASLPTLSRSARRSSDRCSVSMRTCTGRISKTCTI